MCENPSPSSAYSDGAHACTRLATNDQQIRRRLRRYLLSLYSNDPDTIILDEVGLRHGQSRIDIVVVNGSLHGYEIKSDRDTFRRLAGQADTYNKVLDFVTLVAGQRHADQALQTAPQWWGIRVAKGDRRGRIRLVEVRQPLANPAPDRLAIAKLLWREEALAFLENLRAADGVRSKPRRLLYLRLAEIAHIDSLRAYVRDRLRSRKDWRSDERRTSGGG